MSVQTTADDKKNLLRLKLKEIKILLSEGSDIIEEMLDPETWGGKDWNESFRSESEELWNDLNSLSRKATNYLIKY